MECLHVFAGVLQKRVVWCRALSWLTVVCLLETLMPLAVCRAVLVVKQPDDVIIALGNWLSAVSHEALCTSGGAEPHVSSVHLVGCCVIPWL